MRGNLVEQQQRRLAAHGALQTGLREHDRDQQRLLLAGRCRLGGDAFLGVNDSQIGAMRPCHGAAGGRVARPVVRQRLFEPLLGGERRHRVEPALDRPDQGKTSPRKRTLRFGANPVEPLDGVAPRRRDRDPFGRHDLFERAEPGRVGRPTKRRAGNRRAGE